MKINIDRKIVCTTVFIVGAIVLLYLTFTELIRFQAVITFVQHTWGKIFYLLLIGSSLLAIWKLPSKYIERFDIEDTLKRIDLENRIRRTVILTVFSLITVVILINYVYLNYLNVKERQISAIFITASTKLSSDNSIDRIAGIYAIERMASLYTYDRPFAIHLLGAYVRENSLWTEREYVLDPENPPKPRDDIQAAMTAIGRQWRRVRENWRGRIDLQNTDLQGIKLRSAFLENVDFTGAHLEMADLQGADLSHADLEGSHLLKTNLKGVMLSGANLSSANLTGADLSNANLMGANFLRADLTGVKGLKLKQLGYVKTLFGAKLDKELSDKVHFSYPELLAEETVTE